MEKKKLIIIATKLNVTKCVCRSYSFATFFSVSLLLVSCTLVCRWIRWDMAWSRATRLLDNCVISMHYRECCEQHFEVECSTNRVSKIKCIKKMIFILTAGRNDSENEGMNTRNGNILRKKAIHIHTHTAPACISSSSERVHKWLKNISGNHKVNTKIRSLQFIYSLFGCCCPFSSFAFYSISITIIQHFD